MSRYIYVPHQEWPNVIMAVGNQICFIGRAASPLFQHEVKSLRNFPCLPAEDGVYSFTQAPKTVDLNIGKNMPAPVFGFDPGNPEGDQTVKMVIPSSPSTSNVINLFSKKE